MIKAHQVSGSNRRRFLQAAGGALAAVGLPFPGRLWARNHELLISEVMVQEAKGRRLAPVAPNAYAPYRGYDCVEPLLRIRTAQGLEGICHAGWKQEPGSLRKLIGLDPFKLFRFGADDRIVGPAEPYRALLQEIRGWDVALIDLIGKALKRPAATLLGATVRPSVQAYDGSVYMEDLLTAEQRRDLVYIRGSMPDDPLQWAVRKAQWVIHERPEGFKALKIKICREKWMSSPEAALARDIAVTNAIREAIGPDIKLMVDGNRGYWGHPQTAWEYAQGVEDSNVYWMEEMFPEEDYPNIDEFKRRLGGLRNVSKLAAGESFLGGLVRGVYTRRFEQWGDRAPLIDVEQGDMNLHGFLYLRTKAAIEAPLGMSLAPHNFGSKIGFYAQVHLATVTPNWDLCEMDDSQFPALVPEGIQLKGGSATLTGAHGLGVTLREEHLEKPLAVV